MPGAKPSRARVAPGPQRRRAGPVGAPRWSLEPARALGDATTRSERAHPRAQQAPGSDGAGATVARSSAPRAVGTRRATEERSAAAYDLRCAREVNKVTAVTSLWLGPVPSEAIAMHHRARREGMSLTRALVVGNIASHRDCWAFRKKLAEKVGCSVRTVQRAITQAASLGLIGVARAKRNEKPPGLDHDVPCGWSHRWTVGWGKAGAAVKAAVDAARARWMIRRAVATKPVDSCGKPKECRPRGPVPPSPTRRRWSAAELDAELERVQREGGFAGPPPKPPPEKP